MSTAVSSTPIIPPTVNPVAHESTPEQTPESIPEQTTDPTTEQTTDPTPESTEGGGRKGKGVAKLNSVVVVADQKDGGAAAVYDIEYLARKNAHPNDRCVQFDEGPHIYTVNGVKMKTSVTGWLGQFHEHFDGSAVVDRMIASGSVNDPSKPNYAKYHGMTKAQILAMWEANGLSKSGAGTQMHHDIECFCNRMQVHNDSPEYAYFQQYAADHPHLVPYRTEWVVFHDELKLAGSIDIVYENPDGTLRIYDWKRVAGLVDPPASKYPPKMYPTACLAHLTDSKYTHYALQLNLYKYMLESQYGKTVVQLCLVVLHPDESRYHVLEMPDLSAEIADLVAIRRTEVLGGEWGAGGQKRRREEAELEERGESLAGRGQCMCGEF